MGGSFWAPGPPKLTFIESKRCQFLIILSMEQDGVFQKILTSPISLMNIFFGTPCRYRLRKTKVTHNGTEQPSVEIPFYVIMNTQLSLKC